MWDEVQPLVVVTGAGSGMGRSIALDQAALGRQVVLVGRRRDALDATAARGDRRDLFTVVPADMSTADGVAALLEALRDRVVTGFVAAAGGQGDFKEPPADTGGVDASWTDALRKNLFSAVLPIEAVLPKMKADTGRIVLIGSTAGLDGAGGPYATAKAALAGYGRDLAVRAGARGITANTLAPGFVADTEFFTAGGYGDSAAMVDQAAGATLVGRVGRTTDVTSATRWLLDQEAGWITGQTVVISGGTVLAR